jgi:hypothetical protein
MNEESRNYAAVIADEFTTENVNFVPFKQLPVGWHAVIISMAIITDDIHTGLRNPKPKADDKRPVWNDATPQLAVYFQTKDNQGCSRRFALLGYQKFDDLLKRDPEEAKLCTPEGDARYAVDIKDHVRMIDPENTRLARLIVKRLCTVANVPEGIKGSEIPAHLLNKELQIQVGSRIFNGKEYFDVVNFAPVGTPAEELARIPVPQNVMTELPATDDPNRV